MAQDFLSRFCEAWEEAVTKSIPSNVRRVLLRIGFVLGRDGGALGTLAGLVNWGLGGRVGSGKQYISWLHQRDMDRIFIQAIEKADVSGVINTTSPNPVTNAEFMRELRKVLHRPWSPPGPRLAVHVGSAFLRTEASLALSGRRCTPARLLERGFKFDFPTLEPALRNLFAK